MKFLLLNISNIIKSQETLVQFLFVLFFTAFIFIYNYFLEIDLFALVLLL